MDKNGPGSKQRGTCCEKLFNAIRTTSPLVASRFSSQQHHQNAAIVTRPTTPNVSLMTPTPPRDRCPRVFKPYGVVPIVFADQPSPPVNKNSDGRVQKTDPKKYNIASKFEPSPPIPSPKGSQQAIKPKTTTTNRSQEMMGVGLPIHGHENRVPSLKDHHLEKSSIVESIDSMFNEYIDRAGRKIRSPTIVGNGGRKSSMRHDSLNVRVSDFIARAKQKFHNTPSFDESDKEEIGAKENKLVKY